MIHHIGIDEIEPHHWVAFDFDMPGCFAKAPTHDEVIVATAEAIRQHWRWLRRHGQEAPRADAPVEVQVTEDVPSVTSDDGYVVNAFFEDDKRLLTRADVAEARLLLGYARADLLALVEGVPETQLDAPIAREVTGSIRGVLNHIATAENWYLEKLDLGLDRSTYPDDILDRLDTVRRYFLEVLPRLEGLAVITEDHGERWSARKVVRRALWHEIAHTNQIARYLSEQAR